MDSDCIKLASLHSKAVDYPKSGRPVPLEDIPKLKFRERPDWNAPETSNPDPSKGYYASTRAIGRLFRDITLPDIPYTRQARRGPKEKTDDELTAAFAQTNLADEDEDLAQALRSRLSEFINIHEVAPEGMVQVHQIFRRYASELQVICTANALSQSGRLSEEEAIIGTILQKTSQPRKRKDAMAKLREQTDILVRGVREELVDDEDIDLEGRLERAWLAWNLSVLQKKSFGGQSFGWVALGAIFELIKESEDVELEQSRGRFY